METPEQTLQKYRDALRGILRKAGVASNPGVNDSWILDQISTKINGQPLQWLICQKCKRELQGGGYFEIHLNECRRT